LYIDDIRGGTRNLQIDVDTVFAPKLGAPLILKNIVFETNKSILLKESYTELNKLVTYLKRNPTFKINVVGHTDNIGNEVDNLKLSKDRAKAVADYLIEQGINTAFIKYKGLGSSKPIASNDKEVGRKINRRVECSINDK
jgi:outer membrane protein OmpA-like peptidoglycan-associated protein